MKVFYVGVHRNMPELAIQYGPNVLSAFDHFYHTRKGKIDDGFLLIGEAYRTGDLQSHFLDSGAFTLKTRARQFASSTGRSHWEYYDGEDHWKYLDAYGKFIRKYESGIDFYANLDVIRNPKKSWRNLHYMESELGLSPMPVIHRGTNLRWLKRHIDLGYQRIGLGGFTGGVKLTDATAWLDRCFSIICSSKSKIPRVQIHGFGIGDYNLIIRYPWWSVDSTTWTLCSGYGGLQIPHKRNGKFTFDVQPYVIKVSTDNPQRREAGRHLETISSMERKIVDEWIEYLGLPIGTADGLGNVISEGVTNNSKLRRIANILFYEKMRMSLPEWPWPFKHRETRKPLT